MTKFDELFPKREHPQIEERLKKHMTPDELLLRSIQPDIHKFWRCEDRLKPLLTAFVEEMGEHYMPRSSKKRRSLEASARDFVEEYGEDVGMVRWACKQMKVRELLVKDLRSLMHLGPTWRKMGSTEDPRRYLKGIEDECANTE